MSLGEHMVLLTTFLQSRLDWKTEWLAQSYFCIVALSELQKSSPYVYLESWGEPPWQWVSMSEPISWNLNCFNTHLRRLYPKSSWTPISTEKSVGKSEERHNLVFIKKISSIQSQLGATAACKHFRKHCIAFPFFPLPLGIMHISCS